MKNTKNLDSQKRRKSIKGKIFKRKGKVTRAKPMMTKNPGANFMDEDEIDFD